MKRRKYALCALKGSRAGAKAKGPRVRHVTADRFRDARHLCLLSIEACATLLRVSPRTVRNWEAGTVRIPYAAFKLMRILRGYELPGAAWDGWKLVGDTLYSPEGHGFKAADHGWWSLLVRRAAMFAQLLAERDFLRAEVDRYQRQAAGPQQAIAACPQGQRRAARGSACTARLPVASLARERARVRALGLVSNTTSATPPPQSLIQSAKRTEERAKGGVLVAASGGAR